MYQTVNKCKNVRTKIEDDVFNLKELHIIYDELIYDLLYNENDAEDKDEILETLRVCDDHIKFYFYNQQGWFKNTILYRIIEEINMLGYRKNSAKNILFYTSIY